MRINVDQEIPREYDAGVFTRILRRITQQLNLFSEGFIQASTNAATAAPTTGTYQQGDFIRNSAPASGGVLGWVCVVAGTPGTWDTVGIGSGGGGPAHATTHQNGGADEVSVAGLSGVLADPQPPIIGAGATQAVAGNDARLTDARTPTAHAASHKSAGGDSIKLDELAAPTDIATLDSSITAHGLLKKLSNVATQYIDGTGNWTVPAGSASFPADPNADRILFWDDSAGAVAWLSLTGLAISGTAMSVDAASDTVQGKIEIATQAEQETGTDVTRAVTPGRQHFHPSAAKAWCAANVSGTIDDSYNMTSVTDVGAGDIRFNIDTNFSTSNYVPMVSTRDDLVGGAPSNDCVPHILTTDFGAGVVRAANQRISDSAAVDPDKWFFVAFGDQ